MTIRWLFFSAAFLGCHADLVSAAEKPNVDFVFADDWGYGVLRCHDSAFCEPPNVDGITQDRIDFANLRVNRPVCSPRHVAVMTGQFPTRQCVHQHFAGSESNRKSGMPDWHDPEGPSHSLDPKERYCTQRRRQ